MEMRADGTARMRLSQMSVEMCIRDSPHGLILIAKGQVHPLLINLNGAQAHAMRCV